MPQQPKDGKGTVLDDRKRYVRCVECRNNGKTRDFATPSGFLSYLRNYHGAKNTDFVTKEQPNEPR